MTPNNTLDNPHKASALARTRAEMEQVSKPLQAIAARQGELTQQAQALEAEIARLEAGADAAPLDAEPDVTAEARILALRRRLPRLAAEMQALNAQAVQAGAPVRALAEQIADYEQRARLWQARLRALADERARVLEDFDRREADLARELHSIVGDPATLPPARGLVWNPGNEKLPQPGAVVAQQGA